MSIYSFGSVLYQRFHCNAKKKNNNNNMPYTFHALYCVFAERQPRKKWRPLHPPFQFPSSQREEEREEDPGMMEGARDMDPGMMEGMGGIKQVRREDGRYEVRGKLDLEGIPLDEPPQVMDYPMYEDNSHEEAWGQEAGQEELWQEGVGQFEQDMNRDEL